MTVFTFDTQSRKRLELMVDTLSAELGGCRLLKELSESSHLAPGRIILLDDKTCGLKDDINVAEMTSSKLNNLEESERFA